MRPQLSASIVAACTFSPRAVVWFPYYKYCYSHGRVESTRCGDSAMTDEIRTCASMGSAWQRGATRGIYHALMQSGTWHPTYGVTCGGASYMAEEIRVLALRPSKKEEEHKLFQFFLAERRRGIHNTPPAIQDHARYAACSALASPLYVMRHAARYSQRTSTPSTMQRAHNACNTTGESCTTEN